MSSVVLAVVSTLMLAVTGWVVGRAVARDDTAAAGRQHDGLTAHAHRPRARHLLVEAGALNDAERDALVAALGALSDRRIVLNSSIVPVGGSPDITTDALHGVPSADVVTISHSPTRDGQCTLICRAARLTPLHCAMHRLPMPSGSPPRDATTAWQAAASCVLDQFGISHRVPGDMQAAPAFAQDYRAGWLALRQEGGGSDKAALRHLRAALADWPPERDGERAVALANLAHVCLRQASAHSDRSRSNGNSAHVHHGAVLARLLEGLDAAKAALALQYVHPELPPIAGLRALLTSLRAAIANRDGVRPPQYSSQRLEAPCPQRSGASPRDPHPRQTANSI